MSELRACAACCALVPEDRRAAGGERMLALPAVRCAKAVQSLICDRGPTLTLYPAARRPGGPRAARARGHVPQAHVQDQAGDGQDAQRDRHDRPHAARHLRHCAHAAVLGCAPAKPVLGNVKTLALRAVAACLAIAAHAVMYQLVHQMVRQHVRDDAEHCCFEEASTNLHVGVPKQAAWAETWLTALLQTSAWLKPRPGNTSPVVPLCV
jgi:hypothetical protein